ncbi:MAG: 7-cyano-7-deazaguanine synthase, partial [Clostridia bacterium]|nr:7-cyano-7-deazaguanine synthase [Clostridia bacterium]
MDLNKVLVGMSGGVDSSVAALLLKNSGYNIGGVTLSLYDGEKCGSSKDIEVAAAVCEKLNIEHFVFDFKDKFKDAVIEKFIAEYQSGNTPNPCIECNKHIKFGEMLKSANEVGYPKIATGHYAQIKKQGDRLVIAKALDKSKDQSYVLYSLSQNQLANTLLPLGSFSKAEV